MSRRIDRPDGERGSPRWNGPAAEQSRIAAGGTEIRIRRVSRPGRGRAGAGFARLLRARPLLTLGVAFLAGLALARRSMR